MPEKKQIFLLAVILLSFMAVAAVVWLYPRFAPQIQIPFEEARKLSAGEFYNQVNLAPTTAVLDLVVSPLVFSDSQTGISFEHSSKTTVSKNEIKPISPFPLLTGVNPTIAAVFNKVSEGMASAPNNPGWTINYNQEAMSKDPLLKYASISLSLIPKEEYDSFSQGGYAQNAGRKPEYLLLSPEEIKSLNIVPLLYAVPIAEETSVTVEGYLVAKSNHYFLIIIQRSSMPEILKNDLKSVIRSLQ